MERQVVVESWMTENLHRRQAVVDFAKRIVMDVVNIYFQKRVEHRVTYKSGGSFLTD